MQPGIFQAPGQRVGVYAQFFGNLFFVFGFGELDTVGDEIFHAEVSAFLSEFGFAGNKATHAGECRQKAAIGSPGAEREAHTFAVNRLNDDYDTSAKNSKGSTRKLPAVNQTRIRKHERREMPQATKITNW